MVFVSLRSRPSLASSSSPERLAESKRWRLVAAAAKAIAEAARALGDLLLLDSDDVDGDAVELEALSVRVSELSLEFVKHTPMDLRRSLVSWSTSSMPLSLFWVKSRADTSGTYWSFLSRSSS